MILIIDSEKIPEAKIKQSFEEHGFQSVLIARTAEQARNILSSHKENKPLQEITLIIIDSEVEDEDGFELCREFKKTQNIYTILLVSSAENKTAIEKARHSGAEDYAVKPYHDAEFHKHFLKYMASRVVLLVEDDPVIRQMVRGILSKHHIELIEVEDGVNAYNLLNAMLPVRLVLMDIGLPNMSGIQLVEQIRNKAIWRKTAVVMLTASSDVTDVKKCLSAGANDYITKPFKIDEFINRLVKYLPDES